MAKLLHSLKDKAPGSNQQDIDGTRKTSGGAFSQLIWDNNKHVLHFMHAAANGLPVLHLYKGVLVSRRFARDSLASTKQC